MTSTVPVCCGASSECGLNVEINQVDDIITNKCELNFVNNRLKQGTGFSSLFKAIRVMQAGIGLCWLCLFACVC